MVLRGCSLCSETYSECKEEEHSPVATGLLSSSTWLHGMSFNTLKFTVDWWNLTVAIKLRHPGWNAMTELPRNVELFTMTQGRAQRAQLHQWRSGLHDVHKQHGLRDLSSARTMAFKSETESRARTWGSGADAPGDTRSLWPRCATTSNPSFKWKINNPSTYPAEVERWCCKSATLKECQQNNIGCWLKTATEMSWDVCGEPT